MAPTPPNSFTVIPQRQTLFEQVSQSIGEMIHSGHWHPGEMLPNEIELANLFRVSPGTMRRALKLLVDSGVLVRQQGRGTFVAEFSRNETMVYDRFIRLVPDQPTMDAPSPTATELIFFRKEISPATVIDALQLLPGTEVLHAARLLKTATGPVTHDELWANATIFHELNEHNLDKHEEKMLYAFYQRVCGVTITNCTEELRAVLLTDELCACFQTQSPKPAIEVRRTAYTYNNLPVEYHVQISLTDRYHYKQA